MQITIADEALRPALKLALTGLLCERAFLKGVARLANRRISERVALLLK